MKTKTEQGFKATQEEIDAWKKKHRDVFEIEAANEDGDMKRAYLKRPSRNELSYAATVGGKDPMKFNAAILDKCWLAGDEEIKTDDFLFLGVSDTLDKLISAAEASIKKL